MERNEALRRKLQTAHSRFEEDLNLQRRDFNQQRTQVLHQVLEDPSAVIERDELADVNEEFEKLLRTYQIKESEDLEGSLEDRMKTLQNELTLIHLEANNIPLWSHIALDQVTGYVDLSLTEKLHVLEAVVKVTLEADPEFDQVLTTGQDKKVQFIFSLQEQLHVSNPTLARQVLVNALKMTSQLSPVSKDILSQILFNNIWTPKEIKLFIGQVLSVDQGVVSQILHKVCTYRLSCIDALSALKDKHPVKFIQGCASYEMDKDVDTILSEMQDTNCPGHLLLLLEDILRHMEAELPRKTHEVLNAPMIDQVKRLTTSLDFSRPNSDDLKENLVGLSIAVKTCTTFTSQSGEEVKGYFPRPTQLASLLLLLLAQSKDQRGCVLEIGTGEGKTCVLAMFATIQAIRGTKVDIVTSSPLLAIRDQEQWEQLYSMFRVTSSIVPPPNINTCGPDTHDKLIEEAYSKQIVYGTVSTFAADSLREQFERKTTRGPRAFECVVVDEVDYMTLDSGVQVTFLSHQASGMRHVEQVLAATWAVMSACRPIEVFETGEIQWGTRIQQFHKATVQAVMGSESKDFSADDVLQLGVELGFYSQQDMKEINEAECQAQTNNDSPEAGTWKATKKVMAKTGPEVQYNILNNLERVTGHSVAVDCYSLEDNKAKLYGKESSHGDPDVSMLLLENGGSCQLMSEKSLIEGTVNKLKTKIKYSAECSLDSLEDSKGFIVVPSFLKTYVENQLPVFAENALRAIQMTQGREYMIDKAPEADRGGFSESHQYDAIIPVDFQASGVLEKNKRWGDGLQQFLEMKHQLAISQLSIVTNYMSNVHFFKNYLRGKGIYGVSGTLGGADEKTFLKRHYKTESYVIPCHRHKKVVELPAVQVSGGPEWIKVICETTWKAADRGQVVLIISEDVNTADELKTKINSQQRPTQVTMYTISAKHNIEKQNFSKGHVIIATNLGGRGTDIHVCPEVNDCGGLFVLLTYFPGSHRVERQVFGRTSRKGNPGMVQMIINTDHLAPAYQGQSVETMRRLREEHELSRLDSMEKQELLEIEMKENLFSKFCKFLCNFDKNYSEEEKSDITQMKLRNVPECFRIHRSKFDYQIALNSLKESWALWLIFHEEHISRHDEIKTLEEDLSKHLKNTGDCLLQGKSTNSYDYIKQAKSRTDLYSVDKKKCDYGAVCYWQSAAKCDRLYCAVALYNQAYFTISLRKKDYISEAKAFLEKAKISVDVYLAESTNTVMFCNFSITKDFPPHRKNSNLQYQMQARMNIFKSWKGYIESALKTLAQLESSKSDGIVEDSSVYNLSKDKDPITTNELKMLYEFGLGVVFEVKKKPKFCYDALACFLLGVIQIVAGVLVCALSCGAASQFGQGLISEGVSDMIQGLRGMIEGGFDWAQWAIAKAISIGVSLVFGGFAKLKQRASAVFTAAESSSFKHATKYAVQELGKQGCVAALGYVADKGLKALFQRVLRNNFEEKVHLLIKANNDLDNALTVYICSGLPDTDLEDDFKINRACEQQMRQSVDVMTTQVIPDLMIECTTVTKVLDTLSQVSGVVMQHVESQKNFNRMKAVKMCVESAQYITLCAQILKSFSTETLINETFVPQFLKTINELTKGTDDLNDRRNLSEVKRLKHEFLNIITQSISNALIEACSRHMTSFMTKTCVSKINQKAGEAVSNLLGRTDTQSFFDNQLYNNQMKNCTQRPCEPLSEDECEVLNSYIDNICDADHPATALDILVLTESDCLQGKGIKVVMVDENGKKLTVEYYPGKNASAGDIVLRLTKEPENPEQAGVFSWLSKRMRGETSPHTGHFEIQKPDGTVVPVDSERKNCLYHAVAQAMNGNTGDVTGEVTSLRNEVKNSLQQNLHRYAPVLKLQKGYENTYKTARKYMLCGGGKKTQHQTREMYKDYLNKMSTGGLTEDDIKIINTYKLGLVGNMPDVKGVRNKDKPNNNNNNNNVKKNNSPVNADHIPPIKSFKMANEMLQKEENRHLKQSLSEERPELLKLMNEKGNRGLTREVLTDHHRLALTTGHTIEGHRISEMLAKAAVSGNVEKLIKWSLITANPEMSERLRKDAGISERGTKPDTLSKEGVRWYHNVGDTLMVDRYQELGILREEEHQRVMKWLENRMVYSSETKEYKEILKVLNNRNNNNRKR
ncbi:uncharacterized protein LOC125024278 [Mugil cephalus]|uniref:uncharacterized protein LOC125024278 n=1 Tax=Mugil cephalus TaxID=48193 RepID=UPI001FB6A740|nr:uncharacterized protein LOC125024278 [Mugil cephalus]